MADRATFDVNRNASLIAASNADGITPVILEADPTTHRLLVDTSIAANSSINLNQVGGSAITIGQAAMAASLPVVIASNQSNINVALAAGSNVIGALTANQSVNTAQINGVTPLMGNGISGTGSLRVNIASDNSAVSGLGAGATGSAVPSNAIFEAGLAKTALPAAASDGNLTGIMADKFGRQVVIPGTIRDLLTDNTTTISASTSETTILAAGGAGVFLDVVAVMVANTSATAARVDFRDATAGTVRFSIYAPAGDTRGIVFNRPRPQTTANNNWTAQSSASVTDLRIYIQAEQNK